MALMRAAFAGEDGVIQFTVLCTGCLSELQARLQDQRRWSAPIDGGTCAFCEAEIHAAVGLSR